MSGKIEIYQSKDGRSSVEVTFDKETVWLNQTQLSQLFGRDRTVIGRHIRNIFKEGELVENMVCADFAHTTQHGAIKEKKQQSVTKHYNLDVIISVGYRVKSIYGTQFRQWASQRLKEYLIQGYSINKGRLSELKQSFKLLQSTVQSDIITNQEVKEVVDILSEYALGLDILDGYDHQNIEPKNTSTEAKYQIDYKEAKQAIEQLRKKFGGSNLFGNEKDESFKSSISTINQTFGDDYLLDNELYKHRFSVEQLNAWVDGFKTLRVRYETKSKNWLAMHTICFTILFARKFDKSLTFSF